MDTKIEIEGNIEAMDLPTLIQFMGQEGESASVEIEGQDGIGTILIDSGLLCHAAIAQKNGGQLEGEEAFFELLRWQKGHFRLLKNVDILTSTIQMPWDFMLMEGLRKIDEGQVENQNSLQGNGTENLLDNGIDPMEVPGSISSNKDVNKMADLENTLSEIMKIGGAKAAALVDWESGLTLGTIGGGMDIDLAAAGNTNVVRAKFEVMKQLKLSGRIEDILITLTDQYHIIRIMETNQNLFIYLALDRASANLGMARHQLSALEKELKI